MVTHDPISAELEATAIHEAGHAALHLVLSLGLKHVTIVPDYEEMSAGAATHGGEWGEPAQNPDEENDDTAQLRLVAEDAFWLRHAIARYAGAEAVKQLRPLVEDDPEASAAADFRAAVDAVNRITMDEASIDLYFQLAKRRCAVLVEHYAPEIEALAGELMIRKTLTGDDARKVFFNSLHARRTGRLSW